jgi:hypothetical protein
VVPAAPAAVPAALAAPVEPILEHRRHHTIAHEPEG